MKQVCLIHGGNVYDTYDEYLEGLKQLEIKYERILYSPHWKYWLGEQLTDYEVVIPKFPNSNNAKYDEWALYFSKLLPFLRSDATLVGHSLGGIFLARYLSEHADTLHFDKVILLAAPYDDTTSETLATFELTDSIEHLKETAEAFYVFHSRDDKVVPVAEAEKYKKILPDAVVTLFDDRNHFNTPNFPELLNAIKK